MKQVIGLFQNRCGQREIGKERKKTLLQPGNRETIGGEWD